MRINAYILAADPTWLVASIKSYYPHIEKLVVSYDSQGRGWTGRPVRTEECLDRLRRLDVEGKIEWMPGSFASMDSSDYIAADTRQRQQALTAASQGADWVVQIDTDEVLPNWSALEAALLKAMDRNLRAVEWPMKVLYRRLRGGRYLEVVTSNRTTHFEYPGPIAVRPGVALTEARRTESDYLRPVVDGDRFSLQIQRDPDHSEHRIEIVAPDDAISHNSWARSPAEIRSKISLLESQPREKVVVVLLHQMATCAGRVALVEANPSAVPSAMAAPADLEGPSRDTG